MYGVDLNQEPQFYGHPNQNAYMAMMQQNT